MVQGSVLIVLYPFFSWNIFFLVRHSIRKLGGVVLGARLMWTLYLGLEESEIWRVTDQRATPAVHGLLAKQDVFRYRRGQTSVTFGSARTKVATVKPVG